MFDYEIRFKEVSLGTSCVRTQGIFPVKADSVHGALMSLVHEHPMTISYELLYSNDPEAFINHVQVERMKEPVMGIPEWYKEFIECGQ